MWKGLVRSGVLLSLFVVACSSKSKDHLTVYNDASVDSKFVFGKSSDDSEPWNTFVSKASYKNIAAFSKETFAVPSAGHYRYGWTQMLPVPGKPDEVSMQLVRDDTFESDGKLEITLHLTNMDGSGGDGGASTAGGSTSGTSSGSTSGSCAGKGSSCVNDEDCCSTSCGFFNDGKCD